MSFPLPIVLAMRKVLKIMNSQVKSLEATIQKSNQAVEDQNKSTESQKQAIQIRWQHSNRLFRNYSEIENAVVEWWWSFTR